MNSVENQPSDIIAAKRCQISRVKDAKCRAARQAAMPRSPTQNDPLANPTSEVLP